MSEKLKLTKAQRALIVEMGFISNALRNSDEQSPRWYIEGGRAVKRNVAEALIRRGFIKFTGKWGGHPGILGFTVTPAGRVALKEYDHG